MPSPASIATSTAFPWRELFGDARPCVHDLTCRLLLAAVPKYTTDKLQRVLVAAARVITSTRKYDRGLSRLLHEELHWLDVPERIFFKLWVFIHQSLNNKALRYTWWTLVRRRRLYRVDSYLVAPRHRLATHGRRAFVIAGPSAWNDLPDELRDISLSRTVLEVALKLIFLLLLAHRAH